MRLAGRIFWWHPCFMLVGRCSVALNGTYWILVIGMYPESIDAFTAVPRTPTSRLIRSYLKTILANPESRKIFYFLMLNLCYMLIQMLYGVWTNSLGLISDGESICIWWSNHIWFLSSYPYGIRLHGHWGWAVCVGHGDVGAEWEVHIWVRSGPKYLLLLLSWNMLCRYGRIETLSGFANGIFLILISIFIIFEAIQRLYVNSTMLWNSTHIFTAWSHQKWILANCFSLALLVLESTYLECLQWVGIIIM